ncbi:MAG: MBL fold metallo-hydrolase [Dehalococcoidia bacterium]
MIIRQFLASALGDASYLVVSGESAAVVDPQRDVRPYLEAAAELGTTIRFVFETHVHNDYISGGRELAALGAEIVAPAGSQLEFPHRAVGDGDAVRVGNATLRAVAAPGHTYEHTAYLAIDEDGATRGAFTGGALLMAAAGRSDLLGPDHEEELTRLQWETGHRLAAMLTGDAEILPTHGAGSFCSSSGTGMERRAALDVERARNPVLVSPSFEVFRALHLGTRPPIPGYYRHMAPVNRQGPRVYGEPPRPAPLTPDTLEHLLREGVPVVDIRPRAGFAAGHIPGTLSIEASDAMLAYVGWLLPFDSPMALVSTATTDADEATIDLFRIGYEQVRGAMPFDLWTGPTGAVPVATIAEARATIARNAATVIDVRYAHEQEQLPLPGALRRPIDQLPEWIDGVAREPTLVVCASGQRASTVASFLQARGLPVTAVIDGGAADLI